MARDIDGVDMEVAEFLWGVSVMVEGGGSMAGFSGSLMSMYPSYMPMLPMSVMSGVFGSLAATLVVGVGAFM